MKRELICIECPVGCRIEVDFDGATVNSVKGNACPRGKAYAENEVVCPMRTVTSTVRTDTGTLVPVKTDRPVRKSEIFAVMKKINKILCKAPVHIGDVIFENISDGANLVATGNITEEKHDA